MRKRITMHSRLLVLLLVLCLAFTGSGCGAVGGDDHVKVYFENISLNRLVAVDYEIKSAELIDAVRELFSFMQTTPKADTVAVVPTPFVLNDASISQSTLTLDIGGPYDNLSGNAKLLLAAALTKTMTQLAGITYLILKVNGQNATDASGAEYGILRSALFVDVAADDPNNYVNTNLTLYYSNADGNKLLREDVPMIYRKGSSLERTVVEQLIRGPETTESGIKRTLAVTQSLLTITVTDRICYVNLGQELQYEALGVYNYIPVYSIVNSLGALPTIDKVQILVNGSALNTEVGDKISLATPIEPDYSWVEA